MGGKGTATVFYKPSSLPGGLKLERLVLEMPKGRIEILSEYCKSCSLCVDACPKKILRISDKINSKGYRYVEQVSDDCIGCGVCAVRCPDAVIEVFKEEQV